MTQFVFGQHTGIMKESTRKKVALVMGSTSDWATMQHCAALLEEFGIAFHKQVVSAHRTPDLMAEFAKGAQNNGFEIIIAAAGGAAHLPGMIAAYTPLPVIGVPIKSRVLNGVDSLLSIVQMPAGISVATMSIGEAGAKNAAIMSASILSNHDENIKKSLKDFRNVQTQNVLNNSDLN